MWGNWELSILLELRDCKYGDFVEKRVDDGNTNTKRANNKR